MDEPNRDSITPPPFSCAWRGGALHVEPTTAWNGRTVLWVPFASSPAVFENWMNCRYGGHHLWGCIELARAGYRIIIAPRRTGSRLGKHVKADLGPATRHALRLGPDDIAYCNHNNMLWVPLLKKLGRVRAKVVGLTYAREPLPLASGYDAVICLTQVAMEHAALRYPRLRRVHIPWAVELTEHHHAARPYEPAWGLCCGVFGRDFDVIRDAYADLDHPLKLCCRRPDLGTMPPCVELLRQFVSPEQLVRELYRRAAYVLICLVEDTRQREAVGYTNLLEAMSLARPVIMTRTGAAVGDIDVEAAGAGLLIPPHDPGALRDAVRYVLFHPAEAAEMGRRGRALIEQHHTMPRMAADLIDLFEQL